MNDSFIIPFANLCRKVLFQTYVESSNMGIFLQLLDAKYVKLILWEATKKIKQLPNILNVNIGISKQITICGKEGKYCNLLFYCYYSCLQLLSISVVLNLIPGRNPNEAF